MLQTKSVFVLALIPTLLAAQSAPQTPPIHVATHLVQIGVIVRENNGPVRDLAKEDFAVFDRGKPQTIAVFTAESAAVREPTISPPLPANTFSDLPQANAAGARSVTIVLLDNLNTLSGSAPQPYETTPYWFEDHALASAKQHLLEFLKDMGTNDRLAIYGLSDSLRVLCDFTCDRAQLLSVVSKYDTRAKTQRETVEAGQFHLPNVAPEFNQAIDADVQRLAALNNGARAQVTLDALTAIADHVAGIPGRKNLLWLTANLPFSGQAVARILGRGGIAAYPLDARGLLPRSPSLSFEVEPMGLSQVSKALGMNNNPAQTDQPIGIDAMEKMAEDTGGRAFVNTNDLTGAIRHAVEDSAVTYTLGFYIDSAALDGKFHELKVQVRRTGLELRYPKGYFALKDEPATKDERHNTFLVAIKSPLDSAAISLEVRVDRPGQPTPNALVLTGSVGIHDVHFTEAGKLLVGALDVTVLEQDQTGKILHQTANRLNLRFTEEKYSVVLKSGITFRESVPPQNSATTLRVLVQDPATGSIGSVIIPFSQLQ